MSSYDKKKVDEWLDNIRADRAIVVWVALINETNQLDPLICQFNNMTPWERTNCLYGLKDKADQYMSEMIHKSSRVARVADDMA